MCVISRRATVSKTRIFVALNRAHTRQLTVYANRVATQPGAVMILPVPDPDTVQMVNLSGYTNIFDDLERPFLEQTLSYSNDGGRGGNRTNGTLAVTRVGGYEVTIVPTASDFPRLSAEHFGSVDTSLQQIMQQRYPLFGFVVCRLAAAPTEYHPIAYTHKAIRGPTSAPPHLIFVPTYHVHNGIAEMMAHWDHTIYALNVNGTSTRESSREGEFTRSKIPQFDFEDANMVTKIVVQGNANNIDYYLHASEKPQNPPAQPLRPRQTLEPQQAWWCSIQ
jgi:hypothetical protein